ncbi:MAG: hypothetical protein JXR49_09440 [Acidobacteria bacterium]|nr:hypothetical protein [Acidobacteriota bacterium]
MPLIGILILFLLSWTIPAHPDTRTHSISEEAAERFGQKLKDIQDFAPQEESDREQATRITEEEINSYLSMGSNLKYQTCLRTLKMTFKQDILEGLASVDFDCLKEISSTSIPKYISLLFSGTHVITGRGKILSGDGEGRVQLEQARFDNSRLPNFLIEEAVEAVCETQKSFFNPLQPSPLPYSIKRITVHPGYIMVYQ